MLCRAKLAVYSETKTKHVTKTLWAERRNV